MDPANRLALLLDFLHSSAPELFQSASAGAALRMKTSPERRQASLLAISDCPVRSNGEPALPFGTQTPTPMPCNKVDLRKEIMEALDRHFRRLGVNPKQAFLPSGNAPATAAPSSDSSGGKRRGLRLMRPAEPCRECCNAPSGCLNRRCDFHCRNLWVDLYSADEALARAFSCEVHVSCLMEPEGAWETGAAEKRLEALLMELGCWGFQESWCDWVCRAQDGDIACPQLERVQKAVGLCAAERLHRTIYNNIWDGNSSQIPKYLERWWNRHLDNVWQICSRPDVDPDAFLGRPGSEVPF